MEDVISAGMRFVLALAALALSFAPWLRDF
jgi:hypothetical protein